MKCGIVDVGSNTMRLSIYHWEDDRQFKLLMHKKEMAGLASYIQDGVLSDSGILVAYTDRRITSKCSLPMGSLSLYAKYVEGLFPTKKERGIIRQQVETELERAKTADVFCAHLTGVGGTIRAAGKLCNQISGADPDNRIIPAEEIHGLYKDLKKGDQATLRQILRVVPDRIHTVLPGLAILNAILKYYQVETVSVSACGAREGYLLRRVMEVDIYG